MSENDNTPVKTKNERIARKRAEIQKKRRKRRIVVLLIEVVLLAVVVACGFALNLFGKINSYEIDPNQIYTNPVDIAVENPTGAEKETITQTDEEGQNIVIEITQPENNNAQDVEYDNPFSGEGFTTFVVFGMDGRADVTEVTEGSNSDVIILVTLNNETGEIRMASVYRDTIMKVFGTSDFKKANYPICANGVYNAINTLNMNLDLSINHFVCVSWSAAVQVINALGGVDIVLLDKYWEVYSSEQKCKVPYYNGLISEICKETGIESTAIDRKYFNGEAYHCDGVQAVAYMRLRYCDSDLSRTERQREVISKIMDKARKADPSSLLKAWDAVTENLSFSMNQNQVLGMLKNITKYSIKDTTGYPFVLYDGGDYSVASGHQWDIFPINHVENVKKLHEFLYGDTEYCPTATIYNIDKEMREVGNFDENWNANFKTNAYN